MERFLGRLRRLRESRRPVRSAKTEGGCQIMLLWKEFAKDESCDGCPLLENEICPGGFTHYGGRPIEPPCCSFDDNTDLDEWVSDYFERLRWLEAQEDARIQQERKNKERSKKAADTRRAIRWYCRDEIYALNHARKALKAQKAAEHFASSLAEAINITNGVFQYPERVGVDRKISDAVKRLELEVATAKEKYDEKRNEFYTRRRRP